ncbi:PrsW family intramembrane metalloprotease [Stackebrandtia nassauensis]|nr:PrsW family intramembrane metalloprotease [Stackebrandtia nassauensis]
MTSVSPAPPQPPRMEDGPTVPVKDGFSWGRFFMIIGIIVLLAAGAVVMTWATGFNLGLRATMVGLAAAILPVPLLVACFLWLGRYNPKPAWYLVFCFAWGALVATSVALGVNGLGMKLYSLVDWPWPEPEMQSWAEIFTATTVAPVIEEFMKALGPLLIFWFRRRHFTGLVDALVYCGLSAVGFAMVENILYLGRGYAEGSSGDLGAAGGALVATMTFIMRIFFSGFAHPLFTSMTAIGLGLSRRRARNGFTRWLLPVGMILVAMLLHGLWNLMASLGPNVLLSGYLSVMMPIFFSAVGGALWVRAAEARLAVRELADYVDAGWISPPEIAALATYRRRAAARRWARRVAGDTGGKAMRDYQHLATQLALLRDSMRRGVANPDDQQREYALLRSLVACRELFAGADRTMPHAKWDGRYYQIEFPDRSVRQVNPPPQPVMPIPMVVRAPVNPGWPRPRY